MLQLSNKSIYTKLMKALNVPSNKYISNTPTAEFQIRRQCLEEKYVSIINDGNMEIDELIDRVTAYGERSKVASSAVLYFILFYKVGRET